MSAAATNRKLHRWGAILTALPVLVIFVSGALLQLKKDWVWIQPATLQGSGDVPTLSFEEVLEVARGIPELEIESWDDVNRLDVRPGKGMLKVRAMNDWETQIDTASGEVLQTAYRRSDLIESIHDGSWFHDSVKLWYFLPTAFILVGLWFTGIYLWLLPHMTRRRRRQAARARG